MACKAEICEQLGAYKWFMQTELESARSRDQNAAGRTLAEIGQFWTDIIIWVNTDFDGK